VYLGKFYHRKSVLFSPLPFETFYSSPVVQPQNGVEKMRKVTLIFLKAKKQIFKNLKGNPAALL